MYLKQIWVAFDQLINALLAGWADETLSSRCWRQQHKTRYATAVRAINSVFFWQNNHCRGAYNQEKLRMHSAPEFRPVTTLSPGADRFMQPSDE